MFHVSCKAKSSTFSKTISICKWTSLACCKCWRHGWWWQHPEPGAVSLVSDLPRRLCSQELRQAECLTNTNYNTDTRVWLLLGVVNEPSRSFTVGPSLFWKRLLLLFPNRGHCETSRSPVDSSNRPGCVAAAAAHLTMDSISSEEPRALLFLCWYLMK